MESSDVEHHSNILIGEASLELFSEGKSISCHALSEKLTQWAAESESEAYKAAASLAVSKLKLLQPR